MEVLVDVHSHVVPSGDDGVASEEEGLELIRLAAARGTAVLYATPHVWPIDGLDPEREAAVRSAHRRMRPQARGAGVDLQLGFEVTPAPARHDEDPARYRLGELDAVLVEVPFRGPIDTPFRYAELVASSGLVPILAHPERSDAVLAEPAVMRGVRDRGWLVQLNSSSLLGRHGRLERALAWQLIHDGVADLVASDGHRASRPPFLDEARAALRDELGAAGESLVDGSALAPLSRSGGRASGQTARLETTERS